MRWFESLRRTADFTRTQRRGRRVGFRTFHCYGLERPSGPVRVGVSVPTSVGNAVLRNRVRRRIKGALEGLSFEARPVERSLDLVFVAHPEAAEAGYPALAGEVASAVTSLRSNARPRAGRTPSPR